MFLMAFVRAFVQIGTYAKIQKESLSADILSWVLFGSLSVKDSPPSTLTLRDCI